MIAGLNMLAAGRQVVLAAMVAVLVGLASLSAGWVATELIDAGPQPVADSCQGAGSGC